jgi:hypothetical protein
MSTKKQYFVLVHDFPNTKAKRIEIRPAHLSAATENRAVKAAGMSAYLPALTVGAFFTEEPSVEDPLPFAVFFQRGGIYLFRGV